MRLQKKWKKQTIKVDRLQEEADANVTKANTTDEVNNIKAQALQNINAVQPEVVKSRMLKMS